MNKDLTHEQLILLDNLIYLKNYEADGHKTVADVINYMLKEDPRGGLNANRNASEAGTIGEYPGGLSRQEWIRILNLIKKDPVLMSMHIKHRKEIGNTGFKAMVLVHDENDKQNATVIFRGTATDPEWEDNGKTGYETVTNDHRERLKSNSINQIHKRIVHTLPSCFYS